MNSLPESIASKPELDTSFTSTGAKLFHHQEAMQALRDGKGMPISCWIAPTDVCNFKCSYCSVQERAGDSLKFSQITGFLDQLIPLGLKSVTLSGGGNCLVYKCKESGKNIEDVVKYAYERGLEVAMITNTVALADYRIILKDGEPVWTLLKNEERETAKQEGWYIRKGWRTLSPGALDMLTWCRISLAGLDHNHLNHGVCVPDFDQTRTTLGFSWIMGDSFEEPAHKHGWVSTPDDVKTPGGKFIDAQESLPWIEEQIKTFVEKYNPGYVRLLCDCLRPDLIPERHKILTDMAVRIDGGKRVFSQNKPPRQPKKCFKVLTRPCLNADGWTYPCDSTILNKTAGHKFGSAWRVCRWDEVGDLMQNPAKYAMPENICPGCVFPDQVDLINEIVHGRETPAPDGHIEHANFV